MTARFLFWLLAAIALLAVSATLANSLRFGVPMPSEHSQALAGRVWDATALLYGQDDGGDMVMHCSATGYARDGSATRLLTAAHCVGTADERLYLTRDSVGVKTFYPARLVAVGDKSRGDDFAVLSVNATWDVIPLGSGTGNLPGDPVIVVASPLGYGKQVFTGTLGTPSIDRPMASGRLDWSGMLTVSLPVAPGSSGAAVVSAEGNIIGILIGSLNDTGGSEEFGVAVPIRRFLTWRKTHPKATR